MTTPERSKADGADAPVSDAAPRSRRPFLAVGLLVVVAVIAGIVAMVLRDGNSDTAHSIPEIDVAELPRPIAEVVTSAETEVRENPDSAAAWGRLGMVLYAHSLSAEAIVCLQVAEELDPLDRRWPYLRGMIVAEYDLPTGYEHVLRAHELLDTDLSIRTRVADLLFDLRRPEESRQHYEQVLKAEPESPRAALGMARLTLMSNELEESLKWAQLAAAGADGLPEPHQLLARIHQRLGNRDEARAALDVVRSLPDEATSWPDPILAQVNELRKDFGYLNAQAHRLLGQGDTEQGLRLLMQLAEDEPENPQRFTLLATQLIRFRDYAMAKQVLDRGLQRHPDASDLLYLRAVVHKDQRQFEEAERRLREMLTGKPDFAEAHYARGQCLIELGRAEDAAEAFQNVLRFEPLYAPAHIDLARVLLELKRPAEALTHSTTALGIDPGNETALQLQAQAREQLPDTSQVNPTSGNGE